VRITPPMSQKRVVMPAMREFPFERIAKKTGRILLQLGNGRRIRVPGRGQARDLRRFSFMLVY